METKKAITVGVILVIMMITAAVFAVKIARKNSPVSNTVPATSTKSTSKTGSAGGAAESATAVSTDSDIQAVEDDLNSINEEDFSDSALSDQAVGL